MIVLLLAGSTLRAQLPTLANGIQFGGSGSDAAIATAADGAGNSFTTGWFHSSIDVDPGAGTTTLAAVDSMDAFVASYDAAGALRWAFSIGGFGSDEGAAITLDDAGNVIVRGRFAQTVDLDPGVGVYNVTAPTGTYQMFFAKYSPTGAFLWGFALPVFAVARNVATDASGNVFITGYFAGSFDANPGAGTTTLTANGANTDFFVAKFSPAGAFLWAFRVGGAGGENAYSIAADNAGNVYVTGAFSSLNGAAVNFNPATGGKKVNLTSVGGPDMYVAKYSSAGAIVWAFAIGSTALDQGMGIATDGASVAVSGMFGGTADVDPGRNRVNLTANSRQDALIAKYTASGAYVFAVGVSQACTCQGAWSNAIELDAGGGVYATGGFGGTADFDPSPATAYVSSGSPTAGNGYLASYSSTGAFRAAFALSSATHSHVTGLAVANDDVYVAGRFMNAVDLDPTESSATLTSAGGIDGFLAIYSPASLLRPARHPREDGPARPAIPSADRDGLRLR